MSEEKDLGTQIVVMELELANNDKMLFFAESPVYDHSVLSEKGHSSNFYYYNSGTCPTNWLQDLVRVVHISDGDEIDTDPHGVFRLVSVFNPGEYKPEMAIYGKGEKVCCCIVDAHSSTYKLVQSEKLVKYLLLPELAETNVHDAWLSVLNDKHALYCLSKILYEKDIYFNVEVKSDDTYVIYRKFGPSISINPKSKEELDRVKFILEFNVLTACNF